jgi:hypothetical protein
MIERENSSNYDPNELMPSRQAAHVAFGGPPGIFCCRVIMCLYILYDPVPVSVSKFQTKITVISIIRAIQDRKNKTVAE